MTVGIGVLCEDRSAVVLVADRMMTSGLDIEFEQEIRNKITELSEQCRALISGDAFAFTELFDGVSSAVANLKATTVEGLVNVVKQEYQAVRLQRIEERFLLPRGIPSLRDFYQTSNRIPEALALQIISDTERFNYGLHILVGGLTRDRAHLYVVSDPGTSACADSVGFHVIGSGTNLALGSLIASQYHPRKRLPDALRLRYPRRS